MNVQQVALLGHQMFFQYPPEFLDDDDEELLLLILAQNLVKDRNTIPRILDYVDTVVPLYSDDKFRETFRLKRGTFMFLLNLIGGSLERIKDGCEMISPESQLLITLWRLATPDCLRSICEKFNVGKATAHRAVRRVCQLLCDVAPQFIQWPTEERAITIEARFRRKSGFPGVIGAIDGTHIRIPKPKIDHVSYINRKGYHSIQLQVVCDHKKRFTHVYVGQVGSVHDARVFRLSALPEYMLSLRKFPNDSHLLGDSAYPLHKHLMVPFKDYGLLTDLEENFNNCLSSGRVIIENAICLLKTRWRCLLEKLPLRRLDDIPRVIMACCVLHNICIMTNDELQVARLPPPEEDVTDDDDLDEDAEERVLAVAKRNRICAHLPIRRRRRRVQEEVDGE